MAPIRCPYVPGHHYSAHICPGTILVPAYSRASFRCPYVLWHHSGADMCFGTNPVPICARAPFRCPYVLRHHCDANVIPGTLSVPICTLAPFQCPYVFWHQSGSHPWVLCLRSYVPGHPYSDAVEAHSCVDPLLPYSFLSKTQLLMIDQLQLIYH